MESYVDLARRFEPAEGFQELRAAGCPVHATSGHEPPFYVVHRFADVVGVLRTPEVWGNSHGPGVFHQTSGVLGAADEPDHSRQRAVLRASFVPAALARYEPRLVAVRDALLDELVPHGRGDFVEAFAFPFPALAIAELLGVAAEDRDRFGELSRLAVSALTGGDLAGHQRARQGLGDAIEAAAVQRAAIPRGERPADAVTALLDARDDGRIDHEELRLLGYQLLVAGHETTTSLLGLLLHRLVERPELQQRLRDDPALITVAIEEALRFDSPVSGLFRTNHVPTELHGITFEEHTKLQVCFGAANRDPDRFSTPDEFRLDRDGSELAHHVGFGWGIHYCIGAPFARLVARLAFEAVLARMHRIEADGAPVRNDSFVLHGLTRLPVRWQPAGAA